MKAWSQPKRPISKGGDIEKGGDVVRRSQKVGTLFGTPKRWGRRNKVGTSYSAFKHQTNACDKPAGNCLSNQLEDMQIADEARIQQGLAPLRGRRAVRAAHVV